MPFWITTGKDVLHNDVCSDGTNTDFPCICKSDYHCCERDSCDAICCRAVPEWEDCLKNSDGTYYCATCRLSINVRVMSWLNPRLQQNKGHQITRKSIQLFHFQRLPYFLQKQRLVHQQVSRPVNRHQVSKYQT